MFIVVCIFAIVAGAFAIAQYLIIMELVRRNKDLEEQCQSASRLMLSNHDARVKAERLNDLLKMQLSTSIDDHSYVVEMLIEELELAESR